MSEECTFCRIISGDIPSHKLFEDDNFLSFMDIIPATKGHTLVIPKEHYSTLSDVPEDVLGKYIVVIQKVAKAVVEATGAQGFKVENFNGGYAGQAVSHVHFHIIPRYDGDGIKFNEGKNWWVPQPDLYAENEIVELAGRIKEKVE